MAKIQRSQPGAGSRRLRQGRAAAGSPYDMTYETRSAAQSRRAPQSRQISTQQAHHNQSRRRKGRRIVILQGLASILLMIQAYRTRMLPFWILAAVGVALFLLWCFTLSNQRYPVRGALTRAIAWPLTIVMAVGCIFTQQGITALQQITAGENTVVVGLYVLADDPAQKLADTDGYTFGCLSAQDRESTDKTISQISAKVSSAQEPAGYDSVFDLAGALYDGQVQAILLNQSFVSLLEDEGSAYADFATRTRCVYSYTISLGNILGGITGGAANEITKEPFLVYLSGVDTRGDLSDTCRSDVNILAAVNPVTKQVLLVNTPRDYYVPLAGTDGAMDKLTHAGLYGVDCSMETLGALYGVQVDYYMKVDFTGFVDIVNALGGIDVVSDEAFTTVGSPGYYDPTTFVEGVNHMDGAAALAFARERHHVTGGDLGRGKNQMKVIQAILEKAKSPAILTGYSALMRSVSDSFLTNLSQDQIGALVKMQLKDGADWDIQSYSVSGSNSKSTQCYSAKGSNLYVMEPDTETVSTAKAMLQQVLSGGTSDAGSSQPAA